MPAMKWVVPRWNKRQGQHVLAQTQLLPLLSHVPFYPPQCGRSVALDKDLQSLAHPIRP